MEPSPAVRVPPLNAKTQWLQADAWFLQLWKNLGDHMADTEDKTESNLFHCIESVDMDEMELVTSPDHPLWTNAALIPDPSNPMHSHRHAPVKHLNPQRFEDIFLLHELQCGPGAVSICTLRRCWDERWSKFLKIRDIGQGKRCKICAELAEERVQAADPAAQAVVRDKTKFHIDSVMADRNHSVRGNHIAEHDSRVVSVDGFGLIAKAVVDGMDQAKFRVPRNLASSAEFEALWRPQLHVTGCIWHGLIEAYFLMAPDMAKDSNMNGTILCRMLDLAREKQLKDGLGAMPRKLVINADNTTRESKNQFFLGTEAVLVGQNKFSEIDGEFPKTGHTHNELDQRFSSVGTSLSRAPVLEDMHAFKNYMIENVQPARGRDLHVEILESTMNFQKWQACIPPSSN